MNQRTEVIVPPLLIIVNPYANRGDSKHQIDIGLQKLADSGLDFEIKLTEYPGHATELAEQASRQGAPIVVAAGGDGTVHEVGNGILSAAEGQEGVAPTTLGILPLGSGNDFAWGLGIDLSIDDAILRLRRGHTRVIDVAYVEPDVDPPCYCLNNLGGGIDGQINLESRKIKHLRGFAIYFVAVLKTILFYYRTPRVNIRFDGEVYDMEILMIMIANGPRSGGGFLIAPHCTPDDGLLDICIAHKVNRLEMLRMVPRFMRGTHIHHPKITMARAPSIEIESADGFPSQADGEIVGVHVKRLRVTAIPQRLRVIV